MFAIMTMSKDTENIEEDMKMKHLCNAIFNKREFGISLDDSKDWPNGYYRLVDESDGCELGDGYESEEEAIDALFAMYPDNDM